MNLECFDHLAKTRETKLFLEKSYSLELLFYLYVNSGVEGVEELKEALHSRTPKLPAFASYLSLLEASGSIIRSVGKTKKSKVSISLTDKVRKEVSHCMR